MLTVNPCHRVRLCNKTKYFRLRLYDLWSILWVSERAWKLRHSLRVEREVKKSLREWFCAWKVKNFVLERQTNRQTLWLLELLTESIKRVLSACRELWPHCAMWLVMPALTMLTMDWWHIFPSLSSDFYWHQQLSVQESQGLTEQKRQNRCEIHTELQSDVRVSSVSESVFVTPFSNIFVQLNPWKALIQIKINSWTSVKLFNLGKRFSRYEKTLRELKQIVALQVVLTFFSNFPIKRLILINIPTTKITGSCLQNNSKRQKYH